MVSFLFFLYKTPENKDMNDVMPVFSRAFLILTAVKIIYITLLVKINLTLSSEVVTIVKIKKIIKN